MENGILTFHGLHQGSWVTRVYFGLSENRSSGWVFIPAPQNGNKMCATGYKDVVCGIWVSPIMTLEEFESAGLPNWLAWVPKIPFVAFWFAGLLPFMLPGFNRALWYLSCGLGFRGRFGTIGAVSPKQK